MRPDRLSVSLGVAQAARRVALVALAGAVGANGRKGPSLSVLVSALADAYANNPERTAALVRQVITIARDPMVRDKDGRIMAVRLTTADGEPLTLADAQAANPSEWDEFIALVVHGDDEEE